MLDGSVRAGRYVACVRAGHSAIHPRAAGRGRRDRRLFRMLIRVGRQCHGGAAASGAVATGIDFSDAMLRLARAQHPDIDLQQADAEALPIPRPVR